MLVSEADMTGGVTLSFWELIFLAIAPAFVGGLIAVASGVVGPWWLEARKEIADKKRKRAEKFEELVGAVYEHEHWLEIKRDIRAYGSGGDIKLSPLAKIAAISAVYFPVFGKKISELIVASLGYEVWMSKAAMERLKGNAAGMEEGLTEAYGPYIKAHNELLDELKKYARENLQ
jgi:hypothetical protein